MALDPNIALGVRPIELPNQLAQYAQLSQIQNAQQANQLNRMQMAEYERARSEEQTTRNFLGAADLTDPKVRAQLLTGYGKSGREIYGKLSEAEKAQTEEAARRAKLMQDTQSMYRDMSGVISNKADAATFLQRVVNDPALKDSPLAKIPLMEQVARIPEDPAGLDNWKKQFALGATKYITENKPSIQTINQGGQTQVLQTPGLGGAPTSVGIYADVPLPAAVEAQKLRIARAGASSVNLPPQEKAEQGDRGKLLVKQYETISDTARLGARTLPSLESNAAILNKGFDPGFGTEAKAAGAKVLAALGVKDAQDYATSAQTFLGNASSAVLQKQLEQKGPQTEFDAQRITQTGAQLGNTKEANNFFIDVAKEQIKRDIDQRNFYDKWWEQKKTYDGAENAWYSGEGGKSLFDRPGLKKYISPTSAASQIPGQGPAAAPAAVGVSVTLPDGRIKSFPNAEAANQFKKAAGIK